jgi:hypothetical protein
VRPAVLADACRVTAETMHIAIDVRINGDEIGGHGHGASPPKLFSGWLDLMGALDGLVASPSSGTLRPSVRMYLGVHQR